MTHETSLTLIKNYNKDRRSGLRHPSRSLHCLFDLRGCVLREHITVISDSHAVAKLLLYPLSCIEPDTLFPSLCTTHSLDTSVALRPRDLDTCPAVWASLCLLGPQLETRSSESGLNLTTKIPLCRVGAILGSISVFPLTSYSWRCDLFQCSRETASLLSSFP